MKIFRKNGENYEKKAASEKKSGQNLGGNAKKPYLCTRFSETPNHSTP